MRRLLYLEPIDGQCGDIEVPKDMHNDMYFLGVKRTGYIRRRAAFGTDSLNDMLVAAYIQGLTDAAECTPH